MKQSEAARKPKLTMMAVLLRKWRLISELDLRTAAKRIGIGYATLYRIEEGREPDLRTWLKIQEWLWKR